MQSDGLHQSKAANEASDKADMHLRFNQCDFYASDIAEVITEAVRIPGGMGAVHTFHVELKDGRVFQISPDNVVVPSNAAADIYYREKDASLSFLYDIDHILHVKSVRWYLSDAVKEYAREHGIPIEIQYSEEYE